jgi:hypothetical protein
MHCVVMAEDLLKRRDKELEKLKKENYCVCELGKIH